MPVHTVASIYGLCSGVNTITTLRFMEDATTLANKQALAIAIRDRFLPQFKTPCAAAMNWTTIVISMQGNPSDSPYQLAINVVGGGSNLAPHQVAVQWNLNTGVAGRRGRGRLFVPGIHTGAIGAGKIASATKLSMDADMTTINSRWTQGGSEAYHLGVLSRVDNALRIVVQVGYSEIFATLHSRRLGVGI